MKTILQRSLLVLNLSLIISFVFAQAGTLDSSFGVNGKATISFNNPNGEYASTVGIQKDGKIITGGSIGGFSYNSDFALARFLSNGNPDSTFGLNGKVTTHFDYFFSSSYIVKILVQPDGKIIASGAAIVTSNNELFYVNYFTRLNTNGSIDTTFDPGTGPSSLVFATDVLADGKILIGGSFRSFNGVGKNRIARLTVSDVLPIKWLGISAAILPQNNVLVKYHILRAETITTKWKMTKTKITHCLLEFSERELHE